MSASAVIPHPVNTPSEDFLNPLSSEHSSIYWSIIFTIFQVGPFLSYSKAKNFKQFLDFKFETLSCKKNNSRKNKCDISILIGTDCACVDSFDLDTYLKGIKEKLVLFFKNKEKELEILTKKLNQQSSLQNYEEAQKLKIPIFAMVDTNSDPRDVDFVIPSNDDASKSIDKILSLVTDAVSEGLGERKKEKEGASDSDAKDMEEAAKQEETKTLVSETIPEDNVAPWKIMRQKQNKKPLLKKKKRLLKNQKKRSLTNLK